MNSERCELLGAIAVGLALTIGLGAVADMPRPPTAVAGFGFPSIAVTMTTVVFGFFAGLTEGSAFFSRPKEQWFLIWIPLALLAATRFNRTLPAETAHGPTKEA